MTEGGGSERPGTGASHGWREWFIRTLLARRGVARTVNGIPLRVDPAGRHVFTPVYDEGAAAYLRGYLREGMEAWNVGANIGVYALQLAHYVGASGRVVAFEPNPAARAILQRNITHNAVQARVEVVASAVGSAPGTVDFYASGADGMGRAGRPNPQLTKTDRIDVPVTTLDACATARGGVPDLVMMDIEGWEIAALEGARALIGRTRFIVELHPDAWQWSGHSRADLERLLDSAGLVARPLGGQRDPLGELGQVVLEAGERSKDSQLSLERDSGRREPPAAFRDSMGGHLGGFF
jgi:FkbM family methyltransferase